MNNVKPNWLAISAWVVSWLLIFWINFSAELSPLMHFFAVPVLLICTALGVGRVLELSDTNKAGD